MNARLLSDRFDSLPPAAACAADDIPEVLPADGPEAAVDEHSLLGLIELLLKHPARLDQLTRAEERLPELIPRFLALVLISFGAFALTLVLLLDRADRAALPAFLAAHWDGSAGPALSLAAAYTLGLVAASGVCLPSFYFFGLLVGVKASLVQVTGHIMKGKASTAIMLLGILPIYVAVVLGMIASPVFAQAPAPAQSLFRWRRIKPPHSEPER